jgi:serine/threonine-protein kinase HipA
MMEAYRTAYVYVRDTFAGALKETDAGYSFEYDTDYLEKENSTAVSLTLPMKKEAYTSKILFPFFDGLIPEGWLLNIVSENWKIDTKDRFGLLLVACKDPIGNVRIKEERE